MKSNKTKGSQSPFVAVLGIAQDGGVPHCGCFKKCCIKAWGNRSQQKLVSCLGIADPKTKQCWLIDATPDIKFQISKIQKLIPNRNKSIVDGIFLTHGHIGHFTGLIQFEKAVMNTKELPIFVMTKMKALLKANLPWKQMVKAQNISLKPLKNRKEFKLNDRLKIIPILVPHRDEYSETVGFMIIGPQRKVLYIPDIDSWEEFPVIDSLIKQANISFIDGTFFDQNELMGRNIKDVPHPSIMTSLKRFQNITEKGAKKIFFIHLNHTNPALIKTSSEHTLLVKRGFEIASEKQIITL